MDSDLSTHVRHEIYRLRREIRDEEDRHKQAVRVLQAAIRGTQSSCPHKKKTLCLGTPYDPSYYTCDVCGKDDV